MAAEFADLFRLDGRTALVTGGAGYLGSQISEALAELGAGVLVASRNSGKCRRFAASLAERWSVPARGLQLDLTDPASIRRCVEHAEEAAGGFDVLVLCAWSGRKNTWESIGDEDWDHDVEVCLNGVFRMVKAAFPVLERRRGVVLTIGSMYGHVAPDPRLYENVPQANPPSYGAAKAGVIQLTRYLASFLAPHGIRANCISPGPFPFPGTAREHPEFLARLESLSPMGRIGRPHEVKGAAALLCSDAGRYITGQNLCVDGGWTIW